MADFQIEKIGSRIYCINDSWNASFYVIEGEEKAAVIDTGITRGEQIMPVIQKITQKPLCLVITHAHLDHMHHMKEFSEIYMCHDELTMPAEILNRVTGNGDYDFSVTKDIQTGDVIELGGDSLEICKVPGHTPGSVVVLEKKENMLFTGDAIGSGVGVWMQVKGAISLQEYYHSLVNLMRWLVDRGGRMTFWGGHNKQIHESDRMPNGFNPLNLGLLGDMIDLIDLVIKGEITGEPYEGGTANKPGTLLRASYGRAEVLYIKETI